MINKLFAVNPEKSNEKFIFMVAAFFLWLKMCILYFLVFQINLQSVGQGFVLVTTSFGSVVFFLGIGFLFRKTDRNKAFFIIHLLLTALLFGNILYYRFYIDFITVPVLLQFQNVGGLSQSTLELIKYYDLFLFVDTILLAILIKKKIVPTFIQPIKGTWWKRGIATCILIPIILSFIVNTNFWKKSYDKELIVKSVGLYYYHIFDMYQYSKTSIKSVFADGSEMTEIEDYLNQKRKKVTAANLHGVAKGKNVILIFLESTQSFVIDMENKQQEVTPFLNEFKKESLYFPNFYHQTAQGKTSDAEFIIDNGLYPLSGGSVFVRKPKNEYKAIPTILKDHHYYSATFHGNDSQFWNRSIMYEALGYDRFFSKDDYLVTDDNSINYGLKDIPFFEQSIPYLNSLPQPFYAKMLTLTNHFPFLLDPKDQFIPELETEQGVVNRYITTVRYEDEAIKSFFDEIKGSDLYENSIFVLVGDHYGISQSYNDALGELFGHEITMKDQVELQKVPLMIHIPGIEGQVINTVGGQIDLRATIFDLLGIEEKDPTISFGTSLLSHQKNRVVIFRDGTFTTADFIFSEGTCFNKETGDKVKRNNCSPYFNQVQKELNYSDQIIYGDLFRFSGE